MGQRNTANKEKVVEQLTRPVIKLIIALVALAIVRAIVGRLPGLEEASLPGFDYLPLTTVVKAAVTLVMVGIVVNFGREIEPRLRNILSGPPNLVDDGARIAKHLLFLLALIIGYGGLEAVGRPIFFIELGMQDVYYDYLFLLIALVPAGIVSVNIYRNLEDITDILTGKVKTATVSTVACPGCGSEVRVSQDFCPDCGEDIDVEPATQQQEDTGPSTCPECGEYVDSNAAFCGSCGADLQ
jgi:hypothetical protein